MRVVVPANPIRAKDSRDEVESAHHPARCLRSSGCLGRLSLICLGRGGGLKSRTYFSGISSIRRAACGLMGVTGHCLFG
jgi:hypothetical protein